MALAFVLTRRSQVPAEDSPAFGAIAERFRRAGELERAVSLCQEGLLKFPEHLSANVTLGWALLDLGKYKEARTELERVIKRAPDNLAAIRGLAELHDHMENADASDLHGPDWLPVDEPPEAQDDSAIKLETEAPYDPALREVVTEAIAGPEFQLAPDLVTPQDALIFEEDLQSRLPFETPVATEAEPSFENELRQFMRAIGPPVVVIVEEEPVVELIAVAEPAAFEETSAVAEFSVLDEPVPLPELVAAGPTVADLWANDVELPVIDLPVFEVIEGGASEAAASTAVVSMAVRHEARPTPTPALAALERFLRRVETRKLEGRFASVAS